MIFIFDDRIEITSPGKLPNNLTVEKIKQGISIVRNPTLLSYASKLLPYRGIGTGIVRALKHYKDIDFENNIESERFKVTIKRVKQ
jgi:ATP-dependent DNA helicase RecG